MSTMLDRLSTKFLVGDECWEWVAGKNNHGYGMFGVGNQVSKGAHVVLYELLVGPVPEGMELDHSCENRGCVRPSHLRPKTHWENTARSRTNPFAINAAKTHCPKGHEYTESNTYRNPLKGWRQCLACRHERDRKRVR